MIVLYGVSSPNVSKITLMLEETGTEYRFERVDVFKGEQFTPQFGALNPNRRVPVIVDEQGPGGAPYTLFESGAILIYLAEKTGRFLPTAGIPRFEVLKWLMIQIAGVGPMLGQLNHFQFAAPAGNDYSMQRYRTEARRQYELLNTRLATQEYLGGAEYSIADIATYPWALYQARHGFDLAERPHLDRWCKAIGARPAALRMEERMSGVHKEDMASYQSATPAELDRFFGRGAATTT
jgi:GST-like protein